MMIWRQTKRICSSLLSFVRGFMAAGKEQSGNDSITEEDALSIVIIAQNLREIFVYFDFKKYCKYNNYMIRSLQK